MAYQYLDDVATADIAFRASGETLEEIFFSSAEATMNVMVEDLKSISAVERKTIVLERQQRVLQVSPFSGKNYTQ